MLIVIALGGNAILQRHQPLEEAIQKDNIAIAAASIAKVAANHQVVLTHGNGPQVGLLALQNDAYKAVEPYTLDVLGAETEGMIGYLFEQALRNQLPEQEIITLLTQTLVDSKDPAFQNPTKFVGPVYGKAQADKLQQEKGWAVKPDGDYYRRVVPSPLPQAIIELPSIQYILDSGKITLICAGGGGIPVTRNGQGLEGVEAVVDKDRASQVLAKDIQANGLVMLTDVAAVETHFGKPHSKKIRRASPEQLASLDFAQGSMGPKVQSACDFVNTGGDFSAIGSLHDAQAIVQMKAGTFIEKDCAEMEFYNV